MDDEKWNRLMFTLYCIQIQLLAIIIAVAVK